MAQQFVTISELTSTIVPEGQRVRMVIERHPMLEDDEQVEMDASLPEVKAMLESSGQYIVATFHLPDGTSKTNVVEVATFDAAFKGDPYQVLKDAKRVEPKTTRAASGTGTKRDPSELQAVREWCRANGWADMKDKGTVPEAAQAAYDSAHPAEA